MLIDSPQLLLRIRKWERADLKEFSQCSEPVAMKMFRKYVGEHVFCRYPYGGYLITCGVMLKVVVSDVYVLAPFRPRLVFGDKNRRMVVYILKFWSGARMSR